MSDLPAAMLYSLSAITSYGHTEIFLEDHWKLLGAIEAMNGLILFGLTTAFLFAAIELVRPRVTTLELHCDKTPTGQAGSEELI